MFKKLILKIVEEEETKNVVIIISTCVHKQCVLALVRTSSMQSPLLVCSCDVRARVGRRWNAEQRSEPVSAVRVAMLHTAM